MIIKELPKDERPREKLISYGPSVVSNAELLALLIGTGTKKISAIDLSNRILYRKSVNWRCKRNNSSS